MSDLVEVELIHAIAVGFPAIVAAIFAYLGLRQGKETHVQVNSRMDQMLETQRKFSEMVGASQEKTRAALMDSIRAQATLEEKQNTASGDDSGR